MKKSCCAIILACLLVIVSVSNTVKAHEIYSDEIPLKWSNYYSYKQLDMNVMVGYLPTSGDLKYYRKYASEGIRNWNGVGMDNVYVKSSSSEKLNTNVNIVLRVDEDIWNATGRSNTTFAFTMWYDTNNNLIDSSNAAEKSSKRIKMAIVYFNPKISIFRKDTDEGYLSNLLRQRIVKTITHELGHCLCLGHPDREDYKPIASNIISIMRQGFPDVRPTGVSPALHDIRDIYRKYK